MVPVKRPCCEFLLSLICPLMRSHFIRACLHLLGGPQLLSAHKRQQPSAEGFMGRKGPGRSVGCKLEPLSHGTEYAHAHQEHQISSRNQTGRNGILAAPDFMSCFYFLNLSFSVNRRCCYKRSVYAGAPPNYLGLK